MRLGFKFDRLRSLDHIVREVGNYGCELRAVSRVAAPCSFMAAAIEVEIWLEFLG